MRPGVPGIRHSVPGQDLLPKMKIQMSTDDLALQADTGEEDAVVIITQQGLQKRIGNRIDAPVTSGLMVNPVVLLEQRRIIRGENLGSTT